MQRPHPEASLETVQVYQDETKLSGRATAGADATNRALKRELHELFCQHPDQAIFASLPGAGELLAPSLLAKFGDDRERFPTPASVQALAGTCPVTDASGQRRVVKFRHSLRQGVSADCPAVGPVFLAAVGLGPVYWEQVRPRVGHDNDAYRRLANRWLAIAWKLWQTRQPYDEAYHLQQRLQRSKPR